MSCLLGLLLVGPAAAPSRARAPADVVLTVDPASALGPLNRDLVGFGWHEGGQGLDAVAPLRPHLVRIDASLEDVSTAPDAPLVLAPLLERVAAVRATGAEPLVILSYLPAWLGRPSALGRDPTRVRPADLDAWEAVVHDVVLALATAPAPALRFEAWNEPDIPLFWQDTPAAWVDTVERTGRAVAAVEQRTGLDLAFGGPASFVPDPVYLLPFLARFRDPALPLDFVSWHYYGNYPFIGPDGVEFPITAPVQPVLGRPNPIASPAAYGFQIRLMRTMTDAALAGSGRATPMLVLDEWNLSAAGFDRRHDSASGAGFAAAVLTEMQAAGLDAAAYFRATDTRGVPGEHGLATVGGHRKPAWWAFDLWQRLADRRVAVTGDGGLDDLWSVATVADDGTVRVLMSTFRADPDARAPITAQVRLAGRSQGGGTATVLRIDGDHPGPPSSEHVSHDGSGLTVTLAVPGVALVELPPPSMTGRAGLSGPVAADSPTEPADPLRRGHAGDDDPAEPD